jgi:hypothetical protein
VLGLWPFLEVVQVEPLLTDTRGKGGWAHLLSHQIPSK